MVNLSLVTLACQVFSKPFLFKLHSWLSPIKVSQNEPNSPPLYICVELPNYILLFFVKYRSNFENHYKKFSLFNFQTYSCEYSISVEWCINTLSIYIYIYISLQRVFFSL